MRWVRPKLACALHFAVVALNACGDDGGGNEPSGRDDGRGRADASARAGDAGALHAPVTAETSWTHLGFDERSTYYSPHATAITVDNAATLALRWSFTVSGYPTGSVAVAGGTVFALATGGLYAIDLESGEQIWSRSDLGGQSSVAYHGGFLYVHTLPAELHKLDARDGSSVWGPVRTYDHPLADGTSSPVVADGKVLVGHCTSAEIFETDIDKARGGVFAADVETGEQVWRYYTTDPPENGAMVWSTVAVDVEGGAVFATTGNNYTVGGGNSDAIHAIDLQTGVRLWVMQAHEDDVWSLLGGPGNDSDFGANPIVADFGDRQLVAAGDKASAFWALDRADGAVVWSRPALSSSFNAVNGGVLNNGAFDGRRFYVASNEPVSSESNLYALDPADGADVWRVTLDEYVWGMPTVANGVLFVPAGSELRLFEASTGDPLHRLDTGGTIAAGGAAIVQDKVIVKSGLTYPLDASAVRNDQIYCYGLP
jgi:outer membrane protein assembly factor BamB